MNRFACALFLLLAACPPPGTVGSGATSGGASSSSSSGSSSGTGSTTGAPDSGQVPVTSLAVSPATATLSVLGGAAATVQLTAVANGSQPIHAAWTSNRVDLASVDGNGVVSASGPNGGTAVITAVADGLQATALINVAVSQTEYSGTSVGAVGTTFAGTPTVGGSSAPTLLYPTDGTVIPVNLQPLNFQWEAGAGTLFQLSLVGPNGSLTVDVVPANASQPSYQPDETSWNIFAQENIGQTVTVQVLGATQAGGPAFASPTQSLTFAPSRFAGTIYYWTTSAPGQVLQVNSSGTPQPVYTPPLGGGTVPGDTANQCMGCHSVSRDGTRMAAQLWDAAEPNAGTVLDVGESPVMPVVPGGSFSWNFSTFDDTGAFLVTTWAGAFTLRDATSGQPVPAGSGDANLSSLTCGDGGLCSHPSWSADGTSLVYARGLPGHFAGDVDFEVSDLLVAAWSPGQQAFSTPAALVTNDYDGNALANFHPSISIDGKLVAFNRGPCSRSDGEPVGASVCQNTCPASACGITGNVPPGGLRIVPLAGGSPVELTQAEGGDLRNWFPNFSPFQEGGYHWLAFFSLRDYGWLTRGANQRQLWVAAVDANGQVNSDPSHAAFWLPGQLTNTDNDKAEWAPLPCVNQGAGCQGDIDCCSGLVCRSSTGQGSGQAQTCVSTAQSCAYAGDVCAANGDCCSPFSCKGGVCGGSFN